MARPNTRGAPGWRELRAHRIAQQRRARQRPRTEEDEILDELEEEEEEDRAPAQKRRAATRTAPTKRGLLRYDRVPLALFGFAILGLWWAAGGRYTIDGMPLLINAIMEFFHIPTRLGAIADPIWYARLCWLPIAISIIERRNRPRLSMAWNVTIVYAIGIWLIVSGADLGSTWLAITHPDADAWPLAQQVAQIPLLAALWTAATTFAPEIGFAALWKYMRG